MKIQSILRTLLCGAALVIGSAQAADLAPMRVAAHQSIECSTCHGGATPVREPKNAACLQCHQDAAFRGKTARLVLDPHNSPHWGPDVACGTCHRQHQPAQDYCGACHKNVEYRLP